MRDDFAFAKGHGTHNDFILLPDPDGTEHPHLDPTTVVALCDRRRGLGADGLLRLVRAAGYDDPDAERAALDGAEWFMDYRNADGSVSEMCGNGIRVFARYLANEGIVDPRRSLLVGTRAGTRRVTFGDDGEPDLLSAEMGTARVLDPTDVIADSRRWAATHVSLGNPHAVVLVEDLVDAGPLRTPPTVDRDRFPAGVNVEFVRRVGPRHLQMRVYERGVGETRSCGTGACAAAVAVAHIEGDGSRQAAYTVDVPGGRLRVRRHGDGRVELSGPAVIVARGTVHREAVLPRDSAQRADVVAGGAELR